METPPNNNNTNTNSRSANGRSIFAGIGLGLLIGLIVGLSIAQVTGVILGALASLLTAFFGLRPNKDGENGNHVIIGAFGVTCAIAIIGGICIRTHDLLSPSLKRNISEYREANFDTTEIKKIILFQELGIISEGEKYVADFKNPGSSILFAGEDETLKMCGTINQNSSLEDIKSAYAQSGVAYYDIEQELSSSITDPDQLKKVLLMITAELCN